MAAPLQFQNLPADLQAMLVQQLGYTPTPTANVAALLHQHIAPMQTDIQNLIARTSTLQADLRGFRQNG